MCVLFRGHVVCKRILSFYQPHCWTSWGFVYGNRTNRDLCSALNWVQLSIGPETFLFHLGMSFPFPNPNLFEFVWMKWCSWHTWLFFTAMTSEPGSVRWGWASSAIPGYSEVPSTMILRCSLAFLEQLWYPELQQTHNENCCYSLGPAESSSQTSNTGKAKWLCYW